MTDFTFTYSYPVSEQADLLGQVADTPEVFTTIVATTIESRSFAEAFSLFYDRTIGPGPLPMIHDLETCYDAREIANNDNTRVYLDKSYEQAETHGPRAMYDPDRKQWYITGSMYHDDMSYWDAQGIDR